MNLAACGTDRSKQDASNHAVCLTCPAWVSMAYLLDAAAIDENPVDKVTCKNTIIRGQ